jgi:hypothetical protein
MTTYTGPRPYTYLLKCIPTNQYYYGVRWRNRLPAEQDFWIHYFTSSKKVADLRKQYGNSAFLFEIRREFDTTEAAMIWEEKVLIKMKVLQDSKWLNGNIRGSNFRRTGPVSDITRHRMSVAKSNRIVTPKTCAKISQSKAGSVPWNKNKVGVQTHSTETIEKIREASKNQKWTDDRCEKISAAKKGKPSKLKGRPGNPQTSESKQKLSLARAGRKWYNNGISNKISFDHPGDGWVEGRLYY